MRQGRVRGALALLIALLAVCAALLPVLGVENGADLGQDWGLCNAVDNCHGTPGANTSMARVTAWTPRLTVYAGEPNITVIVNVTGAEQYSGDPIGASLVSNLTNPFLAPIKYWGWKVQRDPSGRSPGFDYHKTPALGPTGNTSASFTWVLQAPPTPGNHTIMVRMQTGIDHQNRDGFMNPISRDVFDALPFKVVTPPLVTDATPRDGSVDVFINSPVVLAFSKEMDRASVEAAFTIDPPAPGNFSWEGTVARYDMYDLFEEATNYTYSLDTSPVDVDGLHLLEPINITFTTGSGLDLYPPFIDGFLAGRSPRDAIVHISFSEPMDRGTVHSAFSITPPTPGNLSWVEDVLVFTPDGLLDYDTLYTIRIDASAKDVAGNRIGTDVYYTILTVADTEPPEVLGTSPGNGSSRVPLNSSVSITFSDDVDRDTLPGALSWQPPVQADIRWRNATAVLTPNHLLDEGTVYNLTVGTSLTDVEGNHLEEPYLLTFSTEGSTDRTPPLPGLCHPSRGLQRGPRRTGPPHVERAHGQDLGGGGPDGLAPRARHPRMVRQRPDGDHGRHHQGDGLHRQHRHLGHGPDGEQGAGALRPPLRLRPRP